MATILDGKALAAKCKEAVKKEAESLQRKPGLAVIIVGNNPASRVYVNSKRKDCEDCGFLSEEYAMPEETTQEELITLIETLNGREDIDGILCQLPLPKGIDEEAVLMAISPEKDVDGFHPMNMGSLLIGKEGFLPCTPYGINTHRLIVQARRVAYNGEDDAPAKTVQAVIHYTVRSFKRAYTLYIGAAVILFLVVVLFRRGQRKRKTHKK